MEQEKIYFAKIKNYFEVYFKVHRGDRHPNTSASAGI